MCFAILTSLFLHSPPNICCWPGVGAEASLEAGCYSEYSCYHDGGVWFIPRVQTVVSFLAGCFNKLVGTTMLEEKTQEANAVPAV